MQIQQHDHLTHFEQTMKCIGEVIADKIFSSESDNIGVVFYNTGKSNNPNDLNNVYVVQNLGVPSAERILQVESMLSNTTTAKNHPSYE